MTVIAVIGFATIKGKGIFPAKVISHLILFWEAYQVILTNYYYRINQTFLWAIESFFKARQNKGKTV